MTTAHDDHDFRQFAGRFDWPVAPSPRFAAELRRRLDMTPNSPPVTATIERAATIPAAVPTGHSKGTTDDLPWGAPRWMRAIEAAVAVLLVMSLAGASLYFRQPAAVYDFAFQPGTETVPTEFNFGGNAGRTWVLGDVDPEMGSVQTSSIPQIASNGFGLDRATRLLVGDSFFYTTMRISGSGDFARYDLRSQREVWVTHVALTGPLASDGSLIFGISPGGGGTRTSLLTAFDIESGRIAWLAPVVSNRFLAAASLLVIDDTVYAVDFLGNVVAVDKETGEVRWQTPEPTRTPTADEMEVELPSLVVDIEDHYRAPAIAASDNAIFISKPSRTVSKLDRSTGQELGSIPILDTYSQDITSVNVAVDDEHLVITAIHQERLSGRDDAKDAVPSDVLVFNADSLELKQWVTLNDTRGNLIISGDHIYVPSASGQGEPASILHLDVSTGVVDKPFPEIASMSNLYVSASGNVLMATGDPSTIAFFDLESGELLDTVELGITNMETPFGQPVQMWGANPIVITGLGEVYVVEDDPGD